MKYIAIIEAADKPDIADFIFCDENDRLHTIAGKIIEAPKLYSPEDASYNADPKLSNAFCAGYELALRDCGVIE